MNEPLYESKADRFARAERDGETFEACRFGERVSTCYHVPRCSRELAGFGRYISEQPLVTDREPKAGMKFEHARFLNPKGGKDKALCTVTSVRHGRVYWTYTADYDAGDTRGSWYFKAGEEAGHVGRWL